VSQGAEDQTTAATTARWWRGGLGLWLAGRSCSNLGSAVTTVVVPLVAVVTLQAAPAGVAALVAIPMAAAPAGRLAAAHHAERHPGQVGPMLACDLGRLAGAVAIPVAFATGVLSFPLLATVGVLGALQGAFGAYAAPYVTTLVAPDRLVDANGALSSSSSAAALAGPALAAGILDVAAAPLGLLVEAASYLIAAPTLIRLGPRPRPTPQPSATREPAGDTTCTQAADRIGRRAGFAAFTHPRTAGLLAATFAATVLNGVVLAELAVFMVRHLHVAASVVALVAAAGAIGGVITGLAAGRLQRHLGDRRAIAVGTLAIAASVAFFPLAHPDLTGAWPVLVYELAGSAGGTICVVVTFTAILTHIPAPEIARAMATAAVPEAGQLLGVAVAALAVSDLGVAHLFDVLAVPATLLAATSIAVIAKTHPAPATLTTQTYQRAVTHPEPSPDQEPRTGPTTPIAEPAAQRPPTARAN